LNQFEITNIRTALQIRVYKKFKTKHY